MTPHAQRPLPLEAAWTLPARSSPAAAGPDDWHAGPAAWGARPLQAPRADGLLLLIAAAAAAVAAGGLALVAVGATAAVVAGLLTLTAGGGLACWLDLRSHARGPADLDRGVLVRPIWGLKGRFVGGECVDALPPGTRVALGRNPAGEACLYAHGREYPLARTDLERMRASIVTASARAAGGAA